jgi:hypothetical protein
VQRDLSRVLTEEEELKTGEKWFAKAYAINCGSVIALTPTLI